MWLQWQAPALSCNSILREYRVWSHRCRPLSFYSFSRILDNMFKMAATNDLKSQIPTNHSNHMSSEENAVINHPTDGSGLDIWHTSSKMRQGEGHSCRQCNGGVQRWPKSHLYPPEKDLALHHRGRDGRRCKNLKKKRQKILLEHMRLDELEHMTWHMKQI